MILAILSAIIFALGLAFPGELMNSIGWAVFGLISILPVALVFDWWERGHRMRTDFHCQACGRENPSAASTCSNCGSPLVMESLVPRKIEIRDLVSSTFSHLVLPCLAVAIWIILLLITVVLAPKSPIPLGILVLILGVVPAIALVAYFTREEESSTRRPQGD